jgi:RNA polymerase sigma-70 factor, ECF subfamily
VRNDAIRGVKLLRCKRAPESSKEQINSEAFMEVHSSGASANNKSALFLEIESQRSYLLRFAMAKLRDTDQAEEAVQETLLAALNGADSFAGDASLRTWLTGILKFKIIDCQRRLTTERGRFVEPASDDADDAANPQWFDQFFDATGHWTTKFGEWGQPDAALEQKKLFEAFERCMEKLPPAAARVFFQREVIGDDTEEICKVEGISSSNCWVILHRARVSLRECLERNWFGKAN